MCQSQRWLVLDRIFHLQTWLPAAIAAVILFARSSDCFLHPVSAGEDATQGLNYYTSAHPTILHYYAGYISFLPNVLDWASVKWLPLQAVPFAQAYFALFSAACLAPALGCFFRHALRWPNAQAALAGILITCLPWGDLLAVSNAEYAIWSLLAILLLTALNPVPPSMIGAVRFAAWRLALIASTPLCVICLPTWCILGWRGRKDRVQATTYAMLTIATLLYAHYGIHPAVASTGSGVQPYDLAGGVEAALELATAKSLLAILIRDICRLNFGVVPAFAAILSLVAIILCGLKMLPRPVRAKQSLRLAIGFLLWLLAAVCLACGVGRGLRNGTAFVLASPRYHYVPKILWLVFFAIVIQARTVSPSRYRAPVLVLATVCAALMWQKGLKSYTSDNRRASNEIIAFLRSAEARRSVADLAEMRYRRTVPDGDWNIVLFGPTADTPATPILH